MNEQERNDFIASRINDGLSLSDIQKELEKNGVKMTYMELKLLAADLEVNWKKLDPVEAPKPEPAKAKAKAKPGAPLAAAANDEEGAAYDLDEPETAGGVAEEAPAGAGRAVVTINKVLRPGASLSGDVVFASGAKAEWWVDAYGRLGLNPAAGSAKPSQEDLMDFPQALQDEVRKKYGG